MKKVILLGLMICSVTFAKDKKTVTPPPAEPVAEAPKALPQEMKVGVKGMVCAFCAQGIEKNFKKQPQVLAVEVSLENKYIKLKFKEGQSLHKDKITEILKEAGYEAVYGE